MHGWTPSTQIHQKFLISNKPCKVDNAGLQADGLAAQQQALQQCVQPQLIVLLIPEEGLDIWNNRRRAVHRDDYPFSDHSFTLMTIAHSDLIE